METTKKWNLYIFIVGTLISTLIMAAVSTIFIMRKEATLETSFVLSLSYISVPVNLPWGSSYNSLLNILAMPIVTTTIFASTKFEGFIASRKIVRTIDELSIYALGIAMIIMTAGALAPQLMSLGEAKVVVMAIVFVTIVAIVLEMIVGVKIEAIIITILLVALVLLVGVSLGASVIAGAPFWTLAIPGALALSALFLMSGLISIVSSKLRK